MSITFEHASDTNIFITINDKDSDALDDAFKYLKETTGIYIDPYGSTKIYPDHQKILINYIERIPHLKNFTALIDFLKKAIQNNRVLHAVGD